jgi:hypothetical protein
VPARALADVVVATDGAGDQLIDVGAGGVALPPEQAGHGQPMPAVVDGPAQRGGGSGRAVEPDDDAVHGSSVRLPPDLR